jgi:hypothetical protein
LEELDDIGVVVIELITRSIEANDKGTEWVYRGYDFRDYSVWAEGTISVGRTKMGMTTACVSYDL